MPPTTQNTSKRNRKGTEKVNAEPADKNKPKTQGKRSSKGQNITFTFYMAT